MSDAPEWMGPAHQSAIAFHEAYMTFISAGFTPDQAFDLLKLMIEVNNQ